jgi:extracellular elastinolytic metalloproteinase
VFSFGSSFTTASVPSSNALAKANDADSVNALASVNDILGLSITSGDATAESQGPNSYVIKGTEGAHTDPKAHLVYIRASNDKLVLAWRVETDTYTNWLVSYLNAADPHEILGVVDYTSHYSSATYEV